MQTWTPKVTIPKTDRIHVVGQLLLATVPRWLAAWKPKRHQTLSQWARHNARLTDGGRYRAWPCQDGIADAISDPAIPQVSVKKSARVGYSQIIQNHIGYSIEQMPRRLLIYQPTIDDAETYAKDDVAPVLTWPAVARVVNYKPRDPRNQIRAKRFPGGWVQMKGANSEKEFRRVTADHVILEEPDGYPPPSTTKGGDQVKRAFMRNLTSDEPKKIAGGTPLIKGTSKIVPLFEAGTQEYRYVPCPHCGFVQRLVFGDGTGPGLRWEPRARPERAWYRCAGPLACDIEEEHKPAMDAAGEWRAHAPENWPHRSFHLWAAYSQFDGAAWLEIAKERVSAGKNVHALMTFVNEWLGEEWEIKGEAPAWRRLYDRRVAGPDAAMRPGVIPWDGLLLTAGIDVQVNRVEIYVWAWGSDRQCWLVDFIVAEGNPYLATTWAPVSEVMRRSWRHESGGEMRLSKVGADTGFATTQVEAWTKLHPGLVVAVKGASSHQAPEFAWSDVREAAPKGGKRKRGLRRGLIGGTVLTLELYGLLGLEPPTDEDAAAGEVTPPGFVHLGPLATEEVCKQLVGQDWVETSGEWKDTHRHEALDCWKYARAMFTALGADRWSLSAWRELRAAWGGARPKPKSPGVEPDAQEPPLPPPASLPPPPRVIRSSFIGRVRR